MKKFVSRDNPLYYKNFRLFLTGHFISFVGTWIQQVAIVWLVYEITGSSLFLGVFSFFNAFPMMLFSFLGGFVIDSFDRRKLLATVVLLGMIPPLILGILTNLGKISFPLLTFFGFLCGCFSAIDTPLRQVFISEIVPIKILVKAISFQSLSFNTARMIGPLIAGFLLAAHKPYLCFYINSLSFLPLFLFLVFFIKPSTRSQPLETKGKKNLRTSLKEAVSYLKEHSNLLLILCVVAVFTFFGPSLMVLLPVIVKKVYHGGGKEYGFVSSVIGIGAIFGALSVIFRKDIQDKIKNLKRALILFSFAIVMIGLNKSWILTLACFVLIGFSFTNFFPVANSYVQENTPKHLRGRVVSLFVSAFLGIYPIGNLFTGFLAEHLPVVSILIFYSVLALSLGLYLLTLAKKKEKSII